MRDLFYSPSEKILFLVIGYSAVDSTQEVLSIIEYMKEDIKLILDVINVHPSGIKTKQITKSQRYQGCRVYWTTVKDIPREAFVISAENGWDMWKWLEN